MKMKALSMRLRPLAAISGFWLVTLGISTIAATTAPEERWYVRPATEPMVVTILGLMTTPRSFDTRLVRVTGILSAEFEDQRLYLAKDFYDYRQREYSVALGFTEEQLEVANRLQGRFVIVEGVFSAHPDRAGAPGSLERINRIEALDEPRTQAR